MDIDILLPLLGVSIPIIAILTKLGLRWIEFKERQLQTMSSEAAEKAARYAAQTERLEQRVRVLERIVTEKSIDVSDAIERLRDRPLN